TLGWRSQSRINQSGIMDAFIGPGNCFSVKDEVSAYRDFALPSGPSTTLGAFQPPTVPQPTSYVLLEPSTLLISDVVHAQVYSKLLPKISRVVDLSSRNAVAFDLDVKPGYSWVTGIDLIHSTGIA